MDEELIKQAIEHGNNIGQAALAQFLLRDYGFVMMMNPDLKRFLEKVSQNSFDGIAKDLERPAEDIALEVTEVMAKK